MTVLTVVGLHLLLVLEALAAHGAAVAALVLVLGLDMAAQRVARLEVPRAAGLNARQLLRLVPDGVLAQPRLVPELLATNSAHHCGHFKSFHYFQAKRPSSFSNRLPARARFDFPIDFRLEIRKPDRGYVFTTAYASRTGPTCESWSAHPVLPCCYDPAITLFFLHSTRFGGGGIISLLFLL